MEFGDEATDSESSDDSSDEDEGESAWEISGKHSNESKDSQVPSIGGGDGQHEIVWDFCAEDIENKITKLTKFNI